MPHYLGNTLVVTKDELVPKCYISYEALKKSLQRHKEKTYGIKRFMRGGNGRKLLVLFDSLSQKHQNIIGDPRKEKHPLENFYQIESEATVFYNNFQYPDNSYLRPETAEKLIINASVLVGLVRLEHARKNIRIRMNQSTKGILTTLWRDAEAFNAVLAKQSNDKVQHHLNKSEKRFKQQFREFRNRYNEDHKWAFRNLIKDADGKSKKNAQRLDNQHRILLDNMLAGRDTKPNPTEIAREYAAFLNGYLEVINEYSGELYNPKEYKKLSESSIRNYLATYESKAGTYTARMSDRQKHITDFVPYESLQKPEFAGTIISIDDRQPPFEYEDGKRMWWYIGVDVASQAIVSWVYGKTKKELIKPFYQNMVSNHEKFGVGMPLELECESSLNSSFKDTFLKNGAMFDYVHIHANIARSKYVERMFGKLRYELERHNLGWIGRPWAKREANQTDNTLSENQKKKQGKIIPYDKLVAQCMGDIITFNNMPHPDYPEMSRFDYFLKNQNPDTSTPRYKSFIKELGIRQKTSCKVGLIALQNREWVLGDKGEIATGEELIRLLKTVEGKDIYTYRMEDEKGNILKAYVYDMEEERYICEAIPKPITARAKSEETPELKANRVLFARYRETITNFLKKRTKAIDKVTIIDNRPLTVSNSFTIDGFEAFEKRDTPTQELPNYSDEEYKYDPNKTSRFVKSMKDRFIPKK